MQRIWREFRAEAAGAVIGAVLAICAVLGLALAPQPAAAQQIVNPCVQINIDGACQRAASNYGLTVSTVPGATVSVVSGTNTVTLASSTYSRQLLFASATYTTSSTIGNRYLYLAMYNGSGTKVAYWLTSAAMTASGTYTVEFVPGTYRETAFDTNNSIQTPFPAGLVIPAGYSLKVFDNAGISTSDSESVTFETTQGGGS